MIHKPLLGSEIADFIKVRQRQQVASLSRPPKLVILRSAGDTVADVFLRVKKAYAEDIGAEVEERSVSASDLDAAIQTCNSDDAVDGLVVQLPFAEITDLEKTLSLIDPQKDVDDLAEKGTYDSPTATAIMWLLSGYNIDLAGKDVVVVGHGRLVGRPVTKLLDSMNITYVVIDEATADAEALLRGADIILSGVGKPEIIKADWIKPGAVVVDAGVASEQGQLKGDVEDSARQRSDISITPLRGGVGPLTVSALFENLIRSARLKAD